MIKIHFERSGFTSIQLFWRFGGGVFWGTETEGERDKMGDFKVSGKREQTRDYAPYFLEILGGGGLGRRIRGGLWVRVCMGME